MNLEAISEGLISAFLTAVDVFSSQNLHEKIHYIALLDGRKIYFKNFELSGSKREIRFVAITEPRFNDFKDLDKKFMELKFMLRRWESFLAAEGNLLPEHVEADIKEKVAILFDME